MSTQGQAKAEQRLAYEPELEEDRVNRVEASQNGPAAAFYDTEELVIQDFGCGDRGFALASNQHPRYARVPGVLPPARIKSAICPQTSSAH